MNECLFNVYDMLIIKDETGSIYQEVVEIIDNKVKEVMTRDFGIGYENFAIISKTQNDVHKYTLSEVWTRTDKYTYSLIWKDGTPVLESNAELYSLRKNMEDLKRIFQRSDIKYNCDYANELYSFDIHWDNSEKRYTAEERNNLANGQTVHDFNRLYKMIFKIDN